MNKRIFVMGFLLLPLMALAQQVLTFKEAVKIGLENNLNV